MTDTKHEEKTQDEKLATVRELIKDIDFCMLTTIDEHGHLHSRPMSNNGDVEFDGDLWFFAYGSSHKALEIEREHQVNVAFSNPGKHSFVSLAGTAEIVRDKAEFEKHWSPAFKIWIPDGIDTPDLILIKVEAHTAEYWDSPGKLATGLAIIKGLVTKQEADLGDNESLKIK